jgi:hypothetical protein
VSLVSSVDFNMDILLAVLYKHLITQDSGVKKPEAATAVVELLMMGGRTPETC